MNLRALEMGIEKEGISTPSLIRAPKVPFQIMYRLLKRCFDFGAALTGLILTFPLLFVVAILIVIDSPGGFIYRQVRVGRHGRLFVLYKLRSMVIDAERNGPQWASRNDPRITRVGRIIRKYRIDEIPQFINVLRGDMSIIGPRPERPEFTMDFNKKIPGFESRLQVKPGITGWAQVNGGYERTPAEKLSLDLDYIKNMGLLIDFRILFKTIYIVISGLGAR